MAETTLSRECRVDASAGFSINHLATTEWHEKGLRSFLRYRDLGVTAATGGRVRAEHIQAKAPVKDGTGWHCHDLAFQFVYVLNGWVRFVLDGYGEFLMEPGDAMTVPPRLKHDVTGFSAEFKVLEVNVPADFDTVTD